MEDCGHLSLLDGKQPPLVMNTGYDLAVGDLQVKKKYQVMKEEETQK